MTPPSEPTDRKLDAALLRGFAWTAGAKWATQLITWGSVLIAARLLSPSDFGMVDMSAIFVAIANAVAEFGIGTAVLQMHELDRRTIAQLHTVSLALGGAAFASSIVAAPLLASFFHSEKLRLLVVIYSLSFLSMGFQTVSLGLLQKDMDYRRLSLGDAIASICQAVILSICAYLHMAYWALMTGILANRVATALLAAYWRPVGFAIPRWKDVRGPLRFGWHVMVARLVWVAFAQTDTIVIGRALGSGPLGAYRFAANLASAPLQKIGALIMQVSGPLFANVQTDLARVRRYFLVFADTLALSVGPLAFGLTVVAPSFVAAVLGPKWTDAVTPLRWLAIFGVLRTMDKLTGQVLTSLRHTAFMMWIAMLTAAVMVPSFLVAVKWGPGAVAATWVVMAPITLGPAAVKLLRTIRLSLREYVTVLLPTLVGSAGMAGAVLLAAGYLPKSWSPALRLAIQVATGGAVYSAILLTVYRERVLRYVRFFRQFWNDRAAARKGVLASEGV